MTTRDLAEQEFVAHLFAALDGPEAGAALAQIRAIWEACGSVLRMTQPILEAELSNVLPADPASAPEGALCGQQDPTADFQAVARREHDVLNLSLAFAAPQGAPKRHRGIASATPPGWHEFTRWWRLVTAGGTGALLGEATIYLAKTGDAAQADVRAPLPPRDDDGAHWWTRRELVDDFAFWEVTARGMGASRRMIVLAGEGADEDVRISRFAWSSGGPELPPFGRYLLHAAKLRYLGRVRGDGTDLVRVRERAAATLDRLAELLPQRSSTPQLAVLTGDLAADGLSLDTTMEALRRMRRSVDIARSNMTRALPAPLPGDAAIGDWLAEQLVADADYLEAIHERAGQAMRRVRSRPPEPPQVLPVLPARTQARVEHRIGFGVDAIGYSSRATPAQGALQERVAALVDRVLTEIGVALHDTDRQPAGDGLMVVLPPGQEAHRVLPGLLHGWRAQLAADNGKHSGDRIRLRLSVGAGPFTNAPLGFTGRTIIEVGRLLDSAELRRASAEHPDADVVVLVSDTLYKDVVGEGYAGLDPAQFTELKVQMKEYQGSAWLWTGGDRPAGR